MHEYMRVEPSTYGANPDGDWLIALSSKAGASAISQSEYDKKKKLSE